MATATCRFRSGIGVGKLPGRRRREAAQVVRGEGGEPPEHEVDNRYSVPYELGEDPTQSVGAPKSSGFRDS